MHEINSIDVAKRILYFLSKQGFHFNKTKIQKLVYISYGYYLGFHKYPLFTNELALFLPHGPVFIELYNDIEKNGFQTKSASLSCDDLLEIVVEKFGKLNATTLSSWSHREGSAWDMMKKNGYSFGDMIPTELITREFSDLIARSESA